MEQVERRLGKAQHPVITNQGIRCQSSEVCLLCGKPGIVLYTALRDRLFRSPGEWAHLRCPACGLVWLNPRPIPEDIEKIYKDYFTHSSGESFQRPRVIAELQKKIIKKILIARFGYAAQEAFSRDKMIGWLLSLFPSFQERVGRKVMWNESRPGGRLLDVGCGRGEYLAFMRQLGWKVSGVEPDAFAAQAARKKYGLNVRPGPLEKTGFPVCSFHVITMIHVIEHLDNPIATLKECARLLRPGGRIVILSPNIKSWGHRFFNKSWLGLDPPRHYFLFSMKALKKCIELAGLKTVATRAPAQLAVSYWLASGLLQRNKSEGGLWGRLWMARTWKRRLEGMLFYLSENIWTKMSPVGEEILLVASIDNEHQ